MPQCHLSNGCGSKEEIGDISMLRSTFLGTALHCIREEHVLYEQYVRGRPVSFYASSLAVKGECYCPAILQHCDLSRFALLWAMPRPGSAAGMPLDEVLLIFLVDVDIQ